MTCKSPRTPSWSISPAPHSWARQLQLEKEVGRYVGRKEWLQALAATGQNLQQCANAVGIRPRQISDLAQLYGVQFSRRRHLTKAVLAPFVANKMGVKAIAEALDSTPHGVRNALASEFPEYDPPRLRARPLHKSAQCERPNRTRKKTAQREIKATSSPLDLMKAFAAQEMAARRLIERAI